MASNFTGNPNNFLQQTYIIPDDEEERDVKLSQYLNKIATATNSKDSGVYDVIETVTGQQFVPTFGTDTGASATYRPVLRKVIDFGTLPNSTSLSIPHGIDFGSDLSVTRLYGSATDPGMLWFPLPFVGTSLATMITLEINPTNVVIRTGSNRTNFTRSFVIVEWISTI